jgi:hypothetical protein
MKSTAQIIPKQNTTETPVFITRLALRRDDEARRTELAVTVFIDLLGSPPKFTVRAAFGDDENAIAIAMRLHQLAEAVLLRAGVFCKPKPTKEQANP